MDGHDQGPDYRQQQELQEEQDAEICGALARVCLGLGGRKEAQILADALGPRFTDKSLNDERRI